jgi:hypothetical protein
MIETFPLPTSTGLTRPPRRPPGRGRKDRECARGIQRPLLARGAPRRARRGQGEGRAGQRAACSARAARKGALRPLVAVAPRPRAAGEALCLWVLRDPAGTRRVRLVRGEGRGVST